MTGCALPEINPSKITARLNECQSYGKDNLSYGKGNLFSMIRARIAAPMGSTSWPKKNAGLCSPTVPMWPTLQ